MNKGYREFVDCLEESGYSDVEVVLLCPACRGNNLHQIRTEVFEREDDAESGYHTIVTRTGTEVDDNMGGNPSVRRQGLTITFECENCPAKPSLEVYQHKGLTILHLTK